MPQYLGFSTKDANLPKTTNVLNGESGGPGGIRQPIVWGKKFRLVDEKLVVQDFINAMNIPKGSKVGQPDYGSDIWNFVFEPNTADVQFQLENEVRRIASQDPRLILSTIKAFPKENGILIELALAVAPFNNPEVLSVYFDRSLNRAYQI